MKLANVAVLTLSAVFFVGCGRTESSSSGATPAPAKQEQVETVTAPPSSAAVQADANSNSQIAQAQSGPISPNDIERPPEKTPTVERKDPMTSDGKCTPDVTAEWRRIFAEMTDHLKWKLQDMIANPMTRTQSYKLENARKIRDILSDMSMHKKVYGDYACTATGKDGNFQIESAFFDKHASGYEEELSRMER